MISLKLHQRNILCLIGLILLSIECIGEPQKTDEWDLLIFTQSWPISACLNYEESASSSSSNTKYCKMPVNRDAWTIHGIWPTKLHTEGPEFCNKTTKFDPNLLDPIRDKLVEHWPSIQGGKKMSLFWRHEWLKHGTCGMVLEAMDTELKYFQKGLDLFEKFNMTAILNTYNINPSNSDEIHVVDVFNAVQKHLGKNIHINCIRERETKKAYLMEIRMCFDKNFELADCDGIKGRKGRSKESFTNCPMDETLVYPTQLPNPQQSSRFNYLKYLMSALHTIRFLQWLTL